MGRASTAERSKEAQLPETYKIVRFRFDGDSEVIARGLSLEEAQAHCRREDTHGDGWFDGYEKDS